MHSLSHIYLHGLQLSIPDASAIRRLGEARGKQDLFIEQAPEQLETLRQNSIIESSESSNRIEGVVAAEGRVAELVLNAANTMPRDRSENEIAGYRDALKMIHESHEYMPFRPNLVLQLHGTLFRYQTGAGGRWKSTDNEIVEHRPDGTTHVRFRATPAVATPGAMEELTLRFRAALAEDCEPLIAVPLAILDFLCIHPFTDGNGRVARLLTLLLLYQSKYHVGRYISLERVIEGSKETYYEALQRSSENWHESRHDPFPWLRYFWGMLLGASAEFETRVEGLRQGRGAKTQQIREAVLRRLGPFGLKDIQADCPTVSHELIRRVLRQLRDEAVIVPQGRGRGARWILAQSSTETMAEGSGNNPTD